MVSVEACYSEGLGFESPRRLSLLKNVLCRGNKECIFRGRRRRKKKKIKHVKREVESKRVKQEDLGRRQRQSDQERIYEKGFWFVSKTIKW